MRHLTRVGAGLATLAALLALITGTALAGGWAEVVMTDASADPPVAGETGEIEFSLLQHGVTPVDFGNAQLTGIQPDTGQEISVPATNHGKGRWSAQVTFPSGGNWLIGIEHDDLATSRPITVAVGGNGGLAAVPTSLALGMFAAVAVAVVIGMLLFRNRPVAAGRPIRTGG